MSLSFCGDDEEEASEEYNEALALMKEDKLNEAVERLKEIISEYPETRAASEATRKIGEHEEDIGRMLNAFQVAFDTFRSDVGRYPTDEEGCEALLKNPGTVFWDGPYLPESLIPYMKFMDYRIDGRGRPHLSVDLAK